MPREIKSNAPAEKPKIMFRAGFWRVSRMPKPYWRHQKMYTAAHRFVNRLNNAILNERLGYVGEPYPEA